MAVLSTCYDCHPFLAFHIPLLSSDESLRLMNEESAPSEPPAPDIRPPDLHHPNLPKHDSSVINSQIVSRRSHHNVKLPHVGVWILFAFLAAAALPLASASSPSQPGPDPYTSYTTANAKSTPILDLLAYVIISTLDCFSHLFGIRHVSEENVRGLAKRLDQTGKIEAGMIPVLVALSGTFAGLTLGYVVEALKASLTLRHVDISPSTRRNCRY